MNMHSSPHLPARNQITNRPSHVARDGLTSTKKQHHRRDLEDSSSVTSSSTTRQYLCSVCKDTERLPIDPLIACKACKRRFHPKCTNPFPTDAAEFWCNNFKCQGKKNAPRPTSGMSIASRSDSSNTSDGVDARLNCTKEGCSALLLSNISGPLCKLHSIEAKHEASRNAPRAAPSPSKPINKARLYPTKPSDRRFLNRDRPIEKAQLERSAPSKSEVPPTKLTPIRPSHAIDVSVQSCRPSLPACEPCPQPSSSVASSAAVRSPIVTSNNPVDDGLKSQASPPYRTGPPALDYSDLVSRSLVEASNTLNVSGVGTETSPLGALTCWYWANSPVPCKWSDEKCKYLHGISSFGVAEPPPGRRFSCQKLTRSAQDDVASSTNPVVDNMSTESRQMDLKRASGKGESLRGVATTLPANFVDDSSEYEPPSPQQLEASSPEYEPPPPLNQLGLGNATDTIMLTKKDEVRHPHLSSTPVSIAQQQTNAVFNLDLQALSSLSRTWPHEKDDVGIGVVHGLADLNVPPPSQGAMLAKASERPFRYKPSFYHSDNHVDEFIVPNRSTSIKGLENAQVTNRRSSHQESIASPIGEHEDGWAGADALGDMEIDPDPPEPDLVPISKNQVSPSYVTPYMNKIGKENEKQIGPGKEGTNESNFEPAQAGGGATTHHTIDGLDTNATVKLSAAHIKARLWTDSGVGSLSPDSHSTPSRVTTNTVPITSRLNEVESDIPHPSVIMHKVPLSKSKIHSQPQMEAESETATLEGEHQLNIGLEIQPKSSMDFEPKQLANTSGPAWADFIDIALPEQIEKGNTAKVAYNPAALDAYLSKPFRDPEYEPSDRETLNTQIWASINPIKSWPKHYSEEWRSAKMREIAARPKRKSKHRYRRVGDEGPAKSGQEIEQVIEFCESLFGVSLSGIRGGTLGMKDERWVCVKEVLQPEYEEEIQETDSEETNGDWNEYEVPSQDTKKTLSYIDGDGDSEMQDMEADMVDESVTPRRKRKRQHAQ